MNRIRSLREEQGLSLQQLSNAIQRQTGIKISKASLSNYEHEDQEPKKATWQTLADFFHVNLSYIMGLSPNRNPIEEYFYSENVNQLVQLTKENYPNSPKIRSIVRLLSLMLTAVKDQSEFSNQLFKMLNAVSKINPYPDTDSLTINFSTGEMLTPIESAELINDNRIVIEDCANYFASLALKKVRKPSKLKQPTKKEHKVFGDPSRKSPAAFEDIAKLEIQKKPRQNKGKANKADPGKGN